MKGYFGIGVEGISKPYNVGSLFRSANAFGAGFVFTVNASYERKKGGRTDTSKATGSVPFYTFPDVASLILPEGCELVGVELTEDAALLPSFRHPLRAAYVLGPERGSLSPDMLKRCRHTIKIPTRFCLNVGIAGVLAMYDRLIDRGNFPVRPLMPGGPRAGQANAHVHGDALFKKMQPYLDSPPDEESELMRQREAGNDDEGE